MVHSQPGNATPENTTTSFKCSNCGTMFAVTEHKEGDCPVCGFHCNKDSCKKLDASDEGY